MVCFKWEAIRVSKEWYKYYSRVYTFDDDLVDNKKFFKFYYPALQPMVSGQPSFENRRPCVMIASNWIPERLKILSFFATKPEGSLEVYGKTFLPKYERMYKGKIPGSYSGKAKLETLKKYRCCICFENTHKVRGYITEKIFDAFAAGCIPVYWGPENVARYIPRNCFIDYRRFKNNEEMYKFISSMTAFKYKKYISNIRRFLRSRKARLFSPKHFEKILSHAVMA